MRYSHNTFWAVLIIICLFSCRCNTSTNNDNDTVDSCLDDPDCGRIVWGESIDGVVIGDSVGAVMQKLGEPRYITSRAFNGPIYSYYEGDTLRLEVAFWANLTNGVQYIRAMPWYRGKTEVGVGIGTFRDDALETAGQPVSGTVYPITFHDLYEVNQNRFVVIYRDNRIYSIRMTKKSVDIEGQYEVQTVGGEIVAAFAQNAAQYSGYDWPLIIELTNSPSDSVYTGQVELARLGWINIRHCTFPDCFSLDIEDLLGFVETVVFVIMVYDPDSLAGDFYLSGPLIDPFPIPFTAIAE